ncbi:MAG: DegV family EDD domain-containing protein [Lachnospiraceae bacterium]|nr:DegV family EDD domain-containing protein [Lachnospiraceae bacterium]
MKVLNRLKNRLTDYFYDSSIYFKDRTFVLFTFCELFALLVSSIFSVFIDETVTAALVSAAGVIVGGAVLVYFIKKGRMKSAKVVITLILVCVLRPAAFFTKGGIYNGTMIMFLLGGYYLVLVLEGRFRIIICLLDTAILAVCCLIAYHHPEYLGTYSRRNDFINSFIQYVIAFSVLTVLITFWTRIFQKEARKAEEKSKELEELNRTQNRFFSSMSHEIRTPINTVLGLNEIILRQEDASDEIKKDARNIQGAGKMLLALINDILDISKIEAGKMEIVPVNYDMASLISEIVNMIWLKAEEKGLKFNVDIDPNVPGELFGDEVRIKQILINLLNNAVKYTREGSVTLHMECVYQQDGEALLKINVSDTGMGIKQEALPYLFDSFQRVDEEVNRHIEGTGLGLSIVKQLIELMDGEITVNSVYSEGSTFAVTLKQGVTSDRRMGDINITNAGISGSGRFEHSFTAPNARILIVDDNEMNLQVEQKLLYGTQMQIDPAISGQEALALTLRNRYDLIFMDHLMPEMDGIECYEQIRSQKGGLNKDVPIIVLTANAGGENIELYNNTGFDGYLVKPVSGHQLEEMLLAQLPAEKIENRADGEMTGVSMNTASRYARKKPVVIATSTMSDLPARAVKELQISIVPYTVITNEGVFYDNIDIDSEELVRYMDDKTKMVDSEPPTEDVLTAFFSSELARAHHLIYITLTTGSSREYGRAVNVAKSFENVSIVNSECLSTGTGILVAAAARMAQQGMPADKIVSELEEAKKLIRCSFVVRNTDIMARRNRISPFMNNILNTLWMRPVLRMKNDKLGVGDFMFGSEKKCYEKYIKHALPNSVYPDTSFVFITYAGMTEEELLWVEERVQARMKFDNIIFQKASAGISSNCGGGTFGLIYMEKGEHNYSLGSYFSKANEEYEEDDTEGSAAGEDAEADETDEKPSGDDKWYNSIPGIDKDAAIRNSGNEESFLTVLKIFHDTYDVKSGEIRQYYDAGDWENYTIKVHALKSSARLVGAVKLGDDAEALETAGKKQDIEYIMAHHDSLMEQYRAIKDELAPVFGAGDDLPDIPEDTLEDAYGGLLEFAENMDYELAMMVMDSVKEYRLSPADDEIFADIRKKLSDLDWEGIKEVISTRDK